MHLKQVKKEEVKMHKPDYDGRSNGWTDRLKRSAGARFKLMVIEEDMFLCCLVHSVLYDERELIVDKQEQTIV